MISPMRSRTRLRLRPRASTSATRSVAGALTDAVEVKQDDPSSNPMGARLTQNPGSGNSSPAMTASSGRRPPIDHGDLAMRSAPDAPCFYRGPPMGPPPLVKLFASVLRREMDGRYWLVPPAERGRIDVD